MIFTIQIDGKVEAKVREFAATLKTKGAKKDEKRQIEDALALLVGIGLAGVSGAEKVRTR